MATGVSLVIIHHVPPQNHVCRGENGHWSVTSHHTPCAPQNHVCRGENGHWSVTSHHTPMCHLKIMCVEERMATGVSLVIIHHVHLKIMWHTHTTPHTLIKPYTPHLIKPYTPHKPCAPHTHNTHTHTTHHCNHNHYKQKDSCQWVSLNANTYDKVLLCTPNDIRLFMR